MLYLKNLYYRDVEFSFLPLRSVNLFSEAWGLAGKTLELAEKVIDFTTKIGDKLIDGTDKVMELGPQVYDGIYDRLYKDPVPHPKVDTDGLNPNVLPDNSSATIKKAIDIVGKWKAEYEKNIDPINQQHRYLKEIKDIVVEVNEKRLSDIREKENFIEEKTREFNAARVGAYSKMSRIDLAKKELITTQSDVEKRLIWREDLISKNLDTTAIDRDITTLVQNAKTLKANLSVWANDADMQALLKTESELETANKELKELKEKKASFGMPELKGVGRKFAGLLLQTGVITTLKEKEEFINNEVPIGMFITRMIDPWYEKIDKRKVYLDKQIVACDEKIAFLRQKTSDATSSSRKKGN